MMIIVQIIIPMQSIVRIQQQVTIIIIIILGKSRIMQHLIINKLHIQLEQCLPPVVYHHQKQRINQILHIHLLIFHQISIVQFQLFIDVIVKKKKETVYKLYLIQWYSSFQLNQPCQRRPRFIHHHLQLIILHHVHLIIHIQRHIIIHQNYFLDGIMDNH